MRAAPSLLVLALCAALAGCGQGASSSSAGAGDSVVPAPPTPPTADQIKTEVASLPAPYNSGDYEAGKNVFAQCAACHTATEGGPNMTGPNLYGIFGRKQGTAPNFYYSDGLKARGETWDAAKIDTWITNPRALVPDTHMTFPGLHNPTDRINVIAYLKVTTSPRG
jgi:cytochrome c